MPIIDDDARAAEAHLLDLRDRVDVGRSRCFLRIAAVHARDIVIVATIDDDIVVVVVVVATATSR